MINIKSERSIALIAVLLFTLLTMLFQGAIVTYINNQSRLTIKQIVSEKSLYKSGAGLQYAKYLISKEEFNPTNWIPGDGSKQYYSGGITGEAEYSDVGIVIDYEGYSTAGFAVTEAYRARIDTTVTSASGIESRRLVESAFNKYWERGIDLENLVWIIIAYDGIEISGWQEKAD